MVLQAGHGNREDRRSPMTAAPKARGGSDRELADWIKQKTGIEVTTWQLERWRAAGLLIAADRVYPGRGSRASYSEGACDHAAEVAKLSERYSKTDELLRIAFYRGLYVSEEALRSCFVRSLDSLEELIGPAELKRTSIA